MRRLVRRFVRELFHLEQLPGRDKAVPVLAVVLIVLGLIGLFHNALWQIALSLVSGPP